MTENLSNDEMLKNFKFCSDCKWLSADKIHCRQPEIVAEHKRKQLEKHTRDLEKAKGLTIKDLNIFLVHKSFRDRLAVAERDELTGYFCKLEGKKHVAYEIPF